MVLWKSLRTRICYNDDSLIQCVIADLAIIALRQTSVFPVRITIFNEYTGPEEHCALYRPIYLAREWIRVGHQVTIVCASFSHLYFNIPVVSAPITWKTEMGVRFCFLHTPRYTGNGLGRIRNMLLFSVRSRQIIPTLAERTKPHLVISSSVHGLDAYSAHSLARTAKAYYVREVRDLWPLTLTDLGGKPKLHPFVLVLQRAENFSYRNADAVITTLRHSLSHMRSHGLAPSKWHFIPQGTSEIPQPDPLPESHSEVLRRRRAEGRFLVGYAGGHGIANSLDTLVRAAAHLDRSRFGFMLLGHGPEKKRLQSLARQSGIVMDFLETVSKAQVPSFLGRIDAAYLGWQKKPLYRFGISPNKLMDYMLAGKPVIHASDCSPDLVEEYGCGIRVPAESAPAVADSILALSNRTEDERQDMGERGRSQVLQKHNYLHLASQYLRAIFSNNLQIAGQAPSLPD